MGERSSSTICAVVERPNNHCGNDLVDGVKVLSSIAVCVVGTADQTAVCGVSCGGGGGEGRFDQLG